VGLGDEGAVHVASVAAIAVIVLATAYGFVRKAPLSLMYAVAILAVYALQVASSPVTVELGLLAAPGLPPAPWSWVTFEFVHGSETHIFLNLLGLLGPLGIAWEAHVGALIFGFATAPFFMRLPLRGGRGRLIPVKAIADLATTPELQRILGEAERADLPETREAWFESFVRAARCPRCAGPLRRRFGRIVSDCGWRRRL